MKTSFENILTDLQKRHRAYTEVLDKDDPLRTCLALKFPAFTCEVKLDGERLLAHMKKGVVKVHVSSFVWSVLRLSTYISQFYCPCVLLDSKWKVVQ